jgi:hypothetical protein
MIDMTDDRCDHYLILPPIGCFYCKCKKCGLTEPEIAKERVRYVIDRLKPEQVELRMELEKALNEMVGG